MVNNFFSNIYFNYPSAFFLMLLGIPLFILYFKTKYKTRLVISSIAGFPKIKTVKQKLQHTPILFRLLSIAIIIILLAMPYTKNIKTYKLQNGINIIICLDVSGSMLAKDFLPNRLDACKNMISSFLQARPYDNIALIAFSGQPFTACSLTPNNKQLIQIVQGLNGTMLTPGTCIGEGLALSIAQCRNAKGKSIILLFTDGKEEGNNRINAIEAANMAATQQIKIYPIGIGSNNMAAVPVIDLAGNITDRQEKVVLDEVTLNSIAATTNGKYFKAINNANLVNIYKEIDTIEKTTAEIETVIEKKYIITPFIIALLIFIILEFLCRKYYLNN